MSPPTSFILCNVSISYPKRRIFDAFQQKKICIVESIEFMLSDDESDICHAYVYVAKWYNGKMSNLFLEQLHIQRCVEFIDNRRYVWKIIPTPLVIQRNTSQRWFQKVSSIEKEVIVVKIKPKPGIQIEDTGSDTESDSESESDLDLYSELDSDVDLESSVNYETDIDFL